MRLRRPHGRAAVDPTDPRAWATCGRCGMLYNHEKLIYDQEWNGAQLVTLTILICEKCSDVPQQQLRAMTLPPDPEPIQLPRPDIYVGQND